MTGMKEGQGQEPELTEETLDSIISDLQFAWTSMEKSTSALRTAYQHDASMLYEETVTYRRRVYTESACYGSYIFPGTSQLVSSIKKALENYAYVVHETLHSCLTTEKSRQHHFDISNARNHVTLAMLRYICDNGSQGSAFLRYASGSLSEQLSITPGNDHTSYSILDELQNLFACSRLDIFVKRGILATAYVSQEAIFIDCEESTLEVVAKWVGNLLSMCQKDIDSATRKRSNDSVTTK